jgi:hypothetical protein
MAGADLAKEVDAFLASSGMGKTRFGWLVFKSPSGVEHLRNKRNVLPVTIEKVRSFIANPPADAMTRKVHPTKPRKQKVDLKVNAPPIIPTPPIQLDGPVVRREGDPPPSREKLDLSHRQQSDAKRSASYKEAERMLNEGIPEGKASSVHVRFAMRAITVERERAAREADPIEQAKTVIRRATHQMVVGAEIMDGPKGHFYIGRRLVTKSELLAEARRYA